MSNDTATPMVTGFNDIREKFVELLPRFQKYDEDIAHVDDILNKFATENPSLAKMSGLDVAKKSLPVAPVILEIIDMLGKTATTVAKMEKRLGQAATLGGELAGWWGHGATRPISKADDARRAEGSYREAPATPAEITAYVAAMDPEARAALFAKLATGEKP